MFCKSVKEMKSALDQKVYVLGFDGFFPSRTQKKTSYFERGFTILGQISQADKYIHDGYQNIYQQMLFKISRQMDLSPNSEWLVCSQ